jgi:hypothetical protein
MFILCRTEAGGLRWRSRAGLPLPGRFYRSAAAAGERSCRQNPKRRRKSGLTPGKLVQRLCGASVAGFKLAVARTEPPLLRLDAVAGFVRRANLSVTMH